MQAGKSEDDVEELAESGEGLVEGNVFRVGKGGAVAFPMVAEGGARFNGGEPLAGVREARFRAAVAAGRAKRVAEDVPADRIAGEQP